jgi:Tfp pilus assembly protein PilN
LILAISAQLAMPVQKQQSKKPVTKINLLPQKGFSSTTTGRILAWILSTFRVIVIITEIIVMVAFLSRFWLDAQNTDLTEEIDQKKSILTNFIVFEREFRDTQKRSQLYKNFLTDRIQFTTYLDSIRSYMPNDVVLTTIAFSDKQISIQGYSPSENSIEQFQVNLLSTGLFPGLHPVEIKTSLTQIGSLQFTLNADLGGGQL